jgi:hypothetical protein
MAWPDNMSEVNTDLSQEELTLVKFAIDHELVEWDDRSYSLICELGKYGFKFNGHEYVLTELFELVTNVNKKY